MELYNSEDEQVEAIKAWLRQYGVAIVVGAVIAIGGLVGWHYYQKSESASKESVSARYTEVMTSLSSKNSQAESQVETFIKNNASSEYSVLAALQLAKVQAEAGDLEKALSQLEMAQKATKDEALKAISTYRIAKIQEEQGHFGVALTSLSGLKSAAWAGRVSELKGDIFLRQGKLDLAYKSYVEAQQSGDTSQALKMKLDDLAKQGR